MLKNRLQLLIIHAIEERFAPQNRAGFVPPIARALRSAMEVQGPNRKGDGNVLALEFVPDVGSDRVADIVEETMVPHGKLDFVYDGGIGEIHDIDFDRRIGKNALGRPGPAMERLIT